MLLRLPSTRIVPSLTPLVAVMVATLIRKECPNKWDGPIPTFKSVSLSQATRKGHDIAHQVGGIEGSGETCSPHGNTGVRLRVLVQDLQYLSKDEGCNGKVWSCCSWGLWFCLLRTRSRYQLEDWGQHTPG